jgi:hypothetical protein
MNVWLRSLWLDAPETTVQNLTDAWLAGRRPFFEALVEEVVDFDIDTTDVAFAMSPKYGSHLIAGDG